MRIFEREHIGFDVSKGRRNAGSHERNRRAHMLRYPWSRMEGDYDRHILDVAFGNPMLLHEVARGIGTVDLEPQILARIALR